MPKSRNRKNHKEKVTKKFVAKELKKATLQKQFKAFVEAEKKKQQEDSEGITVPSSQLQSV